MSERTERMFWVAVDEWTALAFLEEQDGPDGVVVTSGPWGMVMYGPVDSDRLRDVKLSRAPLGRDRPGHPVWDGDQPPGFLELQRRWKAGAGARARAEKASRNVLERIVARADARKGAGLSPRMENESADTFYRRVAAFYRVAAEQTGKPLQAIEKSAQVPKSTAARWVREARQRGFLEPTTRGRGRG